TDCFHSDLRLATVPALARRIVRPARDLSDDRRIWGSSCESETRAELVARETPSRDNVDIVAPVVARRPRCPVARARAQSVRVRQPTVWSVRPLPARQEIDAV